MKTNKQKIEELVNTKEWHALQICHNWEHIRGWLRGLEEHDL